mgnify:CR=1 FL=1
MAESAQSTLVCDILLTKPWAALATVWSMVPLRSHTEREQLRRPNRYKSFCHNLLEHSLQKMSNSRVFGPMVAKTALWLRLRSREHTKTHQQNERISMRSRILLGLFLVANLSLLTSAGFAQDQAKTALLIANGDYAHFGSLATPVPEARALGAALETIGFDVTIVENANREAMLDAVFLFETKLEQRGGIALLHYGGHGVQVAGKNYLIPADADIPDERRVSTRAVDVSEIMAALDASNSRTNIVILDACRNNPLPQTSGRSATRGLSVVEFRPRNSLIVYSAQPGSVAEDGLFTPALVRNITTPGLSISEVLLRVRREVSDASAGDQLPGSYVELLEPVYLAGGLNTREDAGGHDEPSEISVVPPTPASAPTPEANSLLTLSAGVFLYDFLYEPEPLSARVLGEIGYAYYVADEFAVGAIAGFPSVGLQVVIGDALEFAVAPRAGLFYVDSTFLLGARLYLFGFTLSFDYSFPDERYPGEIHASAGYSFRF